MVSDSITGPNPTMRTVPVESSGAYTAIPAMAERALEKLQERFPDTFFEARRFRNELTLYVPVEQIVEICTFLRDDEELRFNYLSDLTGNDWPDRDPRFEVIYHLYSLEHYTRLRLKVRVVEEEPKVPTVTGVWGTANWHERETFDMFGIVFEGHPDLRRILMPDEWVGHPLRQDNEVCWEEPEFTVRKVHREYAKG